MERATAVLEGVVNFFIILVESFLGLRFLFKFLGANADNGFVEWLYRNSDGLLDPFRSIFPVEVIDGRYVVEFSTLFAMLAYALIGYLVLALVRALSPVEPVTVKKIRK